MANKSEDQNNQVTNMSKHIHPLIERGRGPRPPYLSILGLAPQRYILGPLPKLIIELTYHKMILRGMILFTLCIMGGGIVQSIRTALPLCPCLHLNQIWVEY